jgi:MFS family permease
VPVLAEGFGRRGKLAIYFVGMMVTIATAFGWAFYPSGIALPIFMAVLFFVGFAGGSFALFTVWLPEQYGADVRATAFAFCTSVGRFVGAGVNFALGAAVKSMGTVGTPVALTAIVFGLGLLIIPLAAETKGEHLPG